MSYLLKYVEQSNSNHFNRLRQIFNKTEQKPNLISSNLLLQRFSKSEQKVLRHRRYLIPSALPSAVSTERRISAEEDVHDDAQAPEVTTFVVHQVALGVVHEGLHNLGGHELGRSHLLGV